MQDLLEIRWHGRGGQGAKTAAVLLAEVVSAAGKYIQGFPEYGPERMGAPVLAFNRISDQPISIHCHVTEPDIVVVLDPTLLAAIDVSEGLGEDGVILVNTSESPADQRHAMGLKGRKLYTVDASGIALEAIGRNIPNTPMIGALFRVTQLIEYEAFRRLVEQELKHKFRTKPEVVQGNLEAIERAYEEVQGE